MDRPPPLVLLAYRFVGWRVGPTYRTWVHDDIVRKGWLIRQGAPAMSGLLLIGAAVAGALGNDGSRIWGALFVLTVAALFLRRTLRERALRQQGIDASGDPLPDVGWYTQDDQRVRRNIGSAVSSVVLAVGGLIILGLRS